MVAALRMDRHGDEVVRRILEGEYLNATYAFNISHTELFICNLRIWLAVGCLVAIQITAKWVTIYKTRT